MALQTYTLRDFKGLNLDDDPHEMGFGYSNYAYNWEFSVNGGIRQRPGIDQLSSVAMTNSPRFALPRDGVNKILACAPGDIAVYDPVTGVKTVPGGAPTWTATALTPPAVFGVAAGNRYVFLATTNAGAGVQLRRYEDTLAPVFTVGNSTAVCKPQYVALWPGQNRLVQAGYYAAADSPSGANGGPSTLFFSDENAPETYQATNFVQLDPGDGERITGVVGFQNQLFVFKYTKVYVFYGVDPDDDGAPLPRYRTMTLPDPIAITADPTLWDPVCAGPDGVYFITAQGLWKTTGGTPARVPLKISNVFSGILTGSLIANFRMDVPGQIHLGFTGDRLWFLFVPVGGGTANTALFWDTKANACMGWNFLAPSCVPLYMSGTASWTGTPRFYFGVRGGGIHLWKDSLGVYTDLSNTVAVLGSYETGFDSLGGSGEARIRYIDVWGLGQVAPVINAIGRRAGTSSSTPGGTLSINSNNRRIRSYQPIVGRQFQMALTGLSTTSDPTTLPTYSQVDVRYSAGSAA